MRLVGYTARRPERGAQGVFMPLGDLTVLLGANDAGKTTLLRALDEDLGSGPPMPRGDEVSLDGGALYAEVSDRELSLLIDDGGRRSSERFRMMWDLGGYDDDALDSAQASTEMRESSGRWADALGAASQSPPSFELVLDELRPSHLVCFGTLNSVDQQGHRRTAVYWCLPSFMDLRTEVRAALEESALDRFCRTRPRRRIRRMRIGGPPRHLEMAEAPVVIAPIGLRRELAPPVSLRVPTGFENIRSAIADAVAGVAEVVRHGEADAIEHTFWDAAEQESRKPPGIWLSEGADAWSIDPAALWALDVLAEEAQRLLPGFVRERYRLEISFRRVSRWFTDDPIALRLSSTTDGGAIREFGIDDVAEGLRLWLQLALLGAVQELERIVGRMWSLVDDAVYEGRNRQLSEDKHPKGDFGDEDTPEQDLWHAAIAAIAASSRGSPALPESLSRDRESARARQRILLVDEPERHLNPRLQRQAAAWLERLVIESRTPCVVASHSTAFLSLPTQVTFVHVRRDDGRVLVEPLDPEALDALDDRAAELGFDRGELLSLVGCFLLVEGVHDQILLDAVFGERLRAAGVVVVPLRGSPRRSLLDVDALWRFTTAPVAMALDNIPPDELAAAQAGDEAALTRLTHAGASAEAKAAGILIEAARGMGRPLYVLAHPGGDLIDVLDDQAVTSVYERYPGAEAMQAAWAAHKQAGRDVKDSQRKQWLQDGYGIDNSRDAYERIAEAHVRLGRRPPTLEAIVDRAVHLAMAQRSVDAPA